MSAPARSSPSSRSTGTSSGSRSAARAARCCSSWVSAATSRCGTRSSGPSTPAASRPSPTTRREPATRHLGSSRCGCTAWPRQAAHVLDALGHPDADVLGVSFGGAVAQQLTLAHQHRIRRLVLASTMCGLGGVPGNPLALSLLATPLRYYSPTFMRLTRQHPLRAPGQRGPRPPRAPDRRPPGAPTHAVGLRRTARGDPGLVEPSVAASHPHAHARAHRPSKTPSCPRSMPASSPGASRTPSWTSCPTPATCCSWTTPTAPLTASPASSRRARALSAPHKQPPKARRLRPKPPPH